LYRSRTILRLVFALFILGLIALLFFNIPALSSSQIADQSQNVVRPLFNPSSWLGEGYSYTGYLTFTYYQPNITLAIQSWSKIIANTTTPPTDYKDKFEWQAIKLAFQFPNLLNGTRDSDILNLNLTVMDAVISYLYSRGYYVILSDYDWNSFGSSTWVQDWVNVTKHYKGDNRIFAFDLFNEAACNKAGCTWDRNNVTTFQYNSTEGVESAFSNATKALRRIDPSRVVIWYGPYVQWKIYPPFEQANVIYDFHLYNGNTSQKFITGTVQAALSFSKQYNASVVCLELDSAGIGGISNTSLGIFSIDYMEEFHIAWIDWYYWAFPNWWIPILNGASGVSWNYSTTSSSASTSSSYSSSSTSSSTNLTTFSSSSYSNSNSTSSLNSTTSSSASTSSSYSSSSTSSSTNLTTFSSSSYSSQVNLSQSDTDKILETNTGALSGNTSLSSTEAVLGLFHMNQKTQTALTYGASTFVVIVLVGFLPILSKVNQKR
jgi:hypothetical protein